MVGEELAWLVGGVVGGDAAAVGEPPGHPVSLDGEGAVTPGARLAVLLRDREVAPVQDERPRPVVLRNDVARRCPGCGLQLSGGVGEPVDAVERACCARGRARRARGPGGGSAARRGFGGNPLAHCLDLPDVAPCLGVALELGVDGLDNAAERGQVCRAGGEETQQPPAAQHCGRGALVVTDELRLRGQVAGGRLAEDAPLRGRERSPGPAVSEQDQRPRPEVDVRGQVLPDLVVLVALDRADLLLDRTEPGDRPAHGKPDGGGAEGAHGRVGDQRLLDPDPEPGVVGRLEQWARYPQRLAKRPGQHANPGQPERPQPPQHLPDHRTAQDTILQRVAVDQQWRGKRPETVDPDGVPGPAANDAQIRLPRPDVPDQPVLVVDLTGPPAALDVDPHRPTGQSPHVVREPVEFSCVAIEVGQRQHDRMARLPAAGFVEAG